MKILLVEDSALCRKALTMDLPPDIEVIVAVNVVEAQKALSENKDIHIAIVDGTLIETGDGVVLAKEILKEFPEIIVVANSTDADLNKEFKSLGCVYIAKDGKHNGDHIKKILDDMS